MTDQTGVTHGGLRATASPGHASAASVADAFGAPLWQTGGVTPDTVKPRVTITYCTQCQWLLRAAWMAQELLSTFSTELSEVALSPGTGGVFRIAVSDTVVWDRAIEGSFPEIKTLKQKVRDVVAPERQLGHTDRRDSDPS